MYQRACGKELNIYIERGQAMSKTKLFGQRSNERNPTRILFLLKHRIDTGWERGFCISTGSFPLSSCADRNEVK